MSNYQSKLSILKRPQILIKAARIASQTYRRSRDLSAVLGYSYPIADSLIRQQLFDLGPVDNHRAVMIVAQRCQFAE